MKKILAVLTALMLVLSLSFGAVAETAAEGSTTNVKLTLNSETVSALAGGNETASTIVDLLNTLTIQAVSDGVDREITVSLKDHPVLGFALLSDDTSMSVLSDLFPSYILKVDAAAFGAAAVQPDASALAGLQESFSSILEQFLSKAGAPEAISEELYGAAFTVKMPIEMTTKEAALLILNTVKSVLSDGKLDSYLAQLKQFGINVDLNAEQIDQAISSIEAKSDEELPALDAAVLNNEAGDTLIRVLLSKDEQSIGNIAVGRVAGGVVVDLAVPNKLTLQLQSDAEGATALALEFVPQEGLTVSLRGDISKVTDGQKTADFTVTLNGVDLANVNAETVPGGVLTGRFAIDGKTEIGLQDMQDQQGEAFQGFMADMQAGLFQVLSNVIQAAPEIAPLLTPSQPQQ